MLRAEKLSKECFGKHSYCRHASECKTRIECLERMIERIRRAFLGEELSSRLKMEK